VSRAPSLTEQAGRSLKRSGPADLLVKQDSPTRPERLRDAFRGGSFPIFDRGQGDRAGWQNPPGAGEGAALSTQSPETDLFEEADPYGLNWPNMPSFKPAK